MSGGRKPNLPPGWQYEPTKKATTCDACGHRTEATPGSLRTPSGRVFHLIGNGSASLDRQMVEAILDGHVEAQPSSYDGGGE